jgi:hypothetical protein
MACRISAACAFGALEVVRVCTAGDTCRARTWSARECVHTSDICAAAPLREKRHAGLGIGRSGRNHRSSRYH